MNAARTIPLVERALRLVEEGERDPIRAVKVGPQLARLLLEIRDQGEQQEPAAHVERGYDFPIAALGVTHIVRVQGVTGLNSTAPTTEKLKIEWPGGRGLIRSVFAGTLDGDLASLSKVSLRMLINGSDDLFTDGESPAFVPLIAFQAANHNWFRLKDYEVTAQQRWSVQLAYEGPPLAAPATITPFVLFGYARTSDR
jgi:hypothetical protein